MTTTRDPQPSFGLGERAAFDRDGFVVARGLATPLECSRLKAVAWEHLTQHLGPVEYEADVGYPGAPRDRGVAGGQTVRRLLGAYDRDPAFRDWARDPRLIRRLQTLLGAELWLSRAHHNCVMTKQPAFSSHTGWHQDIRYWAFEHSELVSVWLALGPETPDNGCLWVLPGSHRRTLGPHQTDAAQFLRADLPENQALLAGRMPVALATGDVLFFHGRLLHAAGRNQTLDTKFALVTTYHGAGNRPRPGTRSAAMAEVMISRDGPDAIDQTVADTEQRSDSPAS